MKKYCPTFFHNYLLNHINFLKSKKIMLKTFQKIKSLKSAIIASLSLSMMVACTDSVQDINPTEQVKPSSAKTANVYFNFAPNIGTQLYYDVAGMNTTNKKAIIDAALSESGNKKDFAAYAIAIAMAETEKLISNTGAAGTSGEYPWMDSKPGNVKSGFGANFGVYKMNWFMISRSATILALNKNITLGEFGYGTYGGTGYGQKINDNITLATKILYEYWSTINATPYGEFTYSSSNVQIGAAYSFWGGHRYGITGWYDGKGPTGVNIGRNKVDRISWKTGLHTTGWNDTILYWYAVKSAKNWIMADPTRLNTLRNDYKRYAYDIYNI